MRGYFAIGIEGVSKPGNMGNLIRTAHGFGAAFVFSIQPKLKDSDAIAKAIKSANTSKSDTQIPYFEYQDMAEMFLPSGCQLVAVELLDEAVEMPTFRHPQNAAYILGSERFSVSKKILEKCHHVIKIPTKFCLNVATAGAVVMYDRHLCYGRYADRPVTPSGQAQPLADHVRGAPKRRRASRVNKKGNGN